MTETSELRRFIEMFKCDSARISYANGTMFLVIGYKRRSECEWFKNGQPYDFDYLDEKCIASGETQEELMESATRYKRLGELTWENDFDEIVELLKHQEKP